MVLTYFYRRDQKEQKEKAEEKAKLLENKTDKGLGYAITIKENGSVQVFFENSKLNESPASRKTKDFVNRRKMIQFLGKAITCDLPEIIPEEKGTYVLILYVWKNELTPLKDLELKEPPRNAY